MYRVILSVNHLMHWVTLNFRFQYPLLDCKRTWGVCVCVCVSSAVICFKSAASAQTQTSFSSQVKNPNWTDSSSCVSHEQSRHLISESFGGTKNPRGERPKAVYLRQVQVVKLDAVHVGFRSARHFFSFSVKADDMLASLQVCWPLLIQLQVTSTTARTAKVVATAATEAAGKTAPWTSVR